MPLSSLPVLSLADDKASFSQAIGDSFRTFGFAMVKDHGIDADLIARAWQLTEAFFALPVEEKRKYHNPAIAGARGYTPFGVEIAKDARAHDLKEFWHIGRDLPEGSPLADSMPPNVWPERPEGFRELFQELYAQFDHTGATILSRIAVYLGLEENWFDAGIEDGNSVMRLLHYPPLEGVTGEAIRAGAHGDINLITMLLGAEEAGLEIIDKSGEWLPVSPPPGGLAVNVGDMLERLTNNRLPSTIHRVRNPDEGRKGHARYSMPFFMHPTLATLLDVLPSCRSHAPVPPPITAGALLDERLRAIGLRK